MDTNTAVVLIVAILVLGAVGVVWAAVYNNSFEGEGKDDN